MVTIDVYDWFQSFLNIFVLRLADDFQAVC